jgi:ABC-2 type transport system permease protein
VSAFLSVTRAVAWRAIHNFVSNPAFLLPALIFPLFFFTAFAGGLSSVGNVPGFDFPSGYTAFQFSFVLVQASAFGGVFTGFGIAADFESGFARRMLLAAPNRLAILAGYALAAMTRAIAIATLLFVIALISGMQVDGGVGDVLALVVLVLVVSLIATLFAAGVAFRARTIQAGPAMQMPVFLTLFIAPVFVPLDLLSGWVHTVAQVNPATAVLNASRDLVSGQDPAVLVTLAVLAGLLAVLGTWAVRGLRRAEAAGG